MTFNTLKGNYMYRETPHPFPGNPADFGPCEDLLESRNVENARIIRGHRDNIAEIELRRLMNLRMLRFGAHLRALRTSERIKLAGSLYLVNYYADPSFDL